MKPNKNHPKFLEYREKWNNLAKSMRMETDRIYEEEKKMDSRPCQDGSIDVIRKQYAKKFSALQKEYAYLYTPDK